MTAELRRQTALHECAHAVAATDAGYRLRHISLKETKIDGEPSPNTLTRDEALTACVIRFVGDAASGSRTIPIPGNWIAEELDDVSAAEVFAEAVSNDDPREAAELLNEARDRANALAGCDGFMAKVRQLADELLDREYLAGPTAAWLLASYEVAA